MNKKGISPLIATILVIGITVVIAVLITTWLRGSTEGLQCTQECQISGASECQYASADLDLSYDGTNAVLINSGSRVFTATVIWLDADGESVGTIASNIALDAFASDSSAASPVGAASVKAVAGLTPTLTGDCAGTTCSHVECWESEEVPIV
tara:strand:+ start:130 stop:585 length:456 start_codon:yes stop_codon:yes gene_type:complete